MYNQYQVPDEQALAGQPSCRRPLAIMEMAVVAATRATCRPIAEAVLHITDYPLEFVALNLVSMNGFGLTLLPSEEARTAN